MERVFVLQHEYERMGREDVKFIGVYKTRSDAEAAIERFVHLPGFCHWPDGFAIGEYTLGEDHWTEGFVTIVPVFVRVEDADEEGKLVVVGASWGGDDIYTIISEEVDLSVDRWEFRLGQKVLCEERVVDGVPGCLVAYRAVEE